MTYQKDDLYYREINFVLDQKVDLGRSIKSHHDLQPFIGDKRLRTSWRQLEFEYPVKFYYIVSKLHERYPKRLRYKLLYTYLIS